MPHDDDHCIHCGTILVGTSELHDVKRECGIYSLALTHIIEVAEPNLGDYGMRRKVLEIARTALDAYAEEKVVDTNEAFPGLDEWLKRDAWERQPENIDKTKRQLNDEWAALNSEEKQ